MIIEDILVRIIAVIIASIMAVGGTREFRFDRSWEDKSFLIVGWLGLIAFALIAPWFIILIAVALGGPMIAIYLYLKISKWRLESRLRNMQDTENGYTSTDLSNLTPIKPRQSRKKDDDEDSFEIIIDDLA